MRHLAAVLGYVGVGVDQRLARLSVTSRLA
jgi:hypothetical protein